MSEQKIELDESIPDLEILSLGAGPSGEVDPKLEDDSDKTSEELQRSLELCLGLAETYRVHLDRVKGYLLLRKARWSLDKLAKRKEGEPEIETEHKSRFEPSSSSSSSESESQTEESGTDDNVEYTGYSIQPIPTQEFEGFREFKPQTMKDDKGNEIEIQKIPFVKFAKVTPDSNVSYAKLTDKLVLRKIELLSDSSEGENRSDAETDPAKDRRLLDPLGESPLEQPAVKIVEILSGSGTRMCRVLYDIEKDIPLND